MKREAVQIAAAGGVLYALAKDGTLWWLAGGEWLRVDGLPPCVDCHCGWVKDMGDVAGVRDSGGVVHRESHCSPEAPGCACQPGRPCMYHLSDHVSDQVPPRRGVEFGRR